MSMDVNETELRRRERLDFLESLEFFDSYCYAFSHAHDEEETLSSTPERLIAEMDRNGVARSMIMHRDIPMVGADFTNRKIAETARKYSDRLVGVWTMLPDQCGEIPPPEKIAGIMKENNVRALTLFPKSHLWLANRLSIGRLMDEVIVRRIPVYLDKEKNGGWQWVYDFMREFPETTAIVCGLGLWGEDRSLRPLLEHYRNLHVELSQYWVPEGICDLARLYGADRLLYGSGMPMFGHGSTMLPISALKLRHDDVRLIAGGNMKRLISWH